MESKSRAIGNVSLGNATELDPAKSTLPLILLGDRVLIDPIAPDQYLSEAAKISRPVDFKDPYSRGVIMNIGGSEYGQEIPASLKPGVKVNYYHQSAIDFEIDKKKYHMVRASDIFMII
ncbi:MAG: co-chaperone GroES family protein [Chryseolinea sp.]